jgi:hypothetical protein
MEKYGKYRTQMKCGYPNVLYHKRDKSEATISVIKQLFGEHLTSRSVKRRRDCCYLDV